MASHKPEKRRGTRSRARIASAMYSHLTPGWRRTIKTTLSIAWALVGAGGLSVILTSPNVVIEQWHPLVVTVGGSALALACAASIVGVVTGFYRIEWLSAWVAGLVFAPYATTIWYLYLQGAPERLTASLFNTALLVCILLRVASCAAHAAKLRTEHERVVRVLDALEATTGTIPTGQTDGDG